MFRFFVCVCVSVVCIVSPYVYYRSCLCIQCTVHCHRVETQLQYINIVSYRIASYHKNIMQADSFAL